MAISQITIPYSWYNITSNYNNNTFTIKWANTGATPVTFTIPDGLFGVSDLNAYIQQLCITNGWYLVDSSGNNVYYVVLSTNSNYYKVQLLLLAVPISLPTGYSLPSASNGGKWPGFPTVATAPTFSFPSSGSIGSLIGFAGGSSYGGGTSFS